MPLRLAHHVDEQLIGQAVVIHEESLGYRSFLTSLGREFLTRLYAALLTDHIGFMIYMIEGETLQGFMFVCYDTTRLFPTVMRRWWMFLGPLLKAVIINPTIIKNIMETMVYASRQGGPSCPEMLVMAVDKQLRGQGKGRQLLHALEDNLRIQGYREYKLTVHEDMDKANRFYRNSGLLVVSKFHLYGHGWNVFSKIL